MTKSSQFDSSLLSLQSLSPSHSQDFFIHRPLVVQLCRSVEKQAGCGQGFSSLLSPQSLSPSHNHACAMHLPPFGQRKNPSSHAGSAASLVPSALLSEPDPEPSCEAALKPPVSPSLIDSKLTVPELSIVSASLALSTLLSEPDPELSCEAALKPEGQFASSL